MSTDLITEPTVNSRRILLPYAVALMAAMTLVQSVIAATGGDITAFAGIATGIVGLSAVAWMWVNRRRLARVRFGRVIAHALAFVAITVSFNTHLVVRTLALAGQENGFTLAAQNLLATPWFGATVVMSAAWGFGLLLHLIGSILTRGWED